MKKEFKSEFYGQTGEHMVESSDALVGLAVALGGCKRSNIKRRGVALNAEAFG